MSWLSSWLTNEPQRDAAKRAANAARSQQWQARSDVQSYLTQGRSAYQNLINYLSGSEQQSNIFLDKNYAQQQLELEAFLGQEEKNMMRGIEDTLQAVNRQQSASGLYGGMQATNAAQPAITNALQNFFSTALSSKLNLTQQYAQNKMAMSQAMMGYLSGAQSGMAGMYGNMAGAAYGGYSNASGAVTQAAGMVTGSSPINQLLGLAGTVFEGVKAFNPSKTYNFYAAPQGR